MDFGPEINSPEAQRRAQEIYDEWVNAGADPRLAMYMVGVSFHESNNFDLNAHDQPRAYGLYQTDTPMWRHMQRVGGEIPSIHNQLQVYLQHLKQYKGGSLWNEINAAAGDPDKIFDAFHDSKDFAFDARTREPAARYANEFSNIIRPAGPSPEMVRGYAGFNATTAPSPIDAFVHGLTSPAGLSPQQQTQQAINFQYAYPPSVSDMTGNYQQPEAFTAAPEATYEPSNVPTSEASPTPTEDYYRGASDYFPSSEPLPGIGTPFVEMGPTEGGGIEAPPQLLSDIATYDPSGEHAFSAYDPNFSYGNPGNIPEGMSAGPQDLSGNLNIEPTYQYEGDFQPRTGAAPASAPSAPSGFDPYNWPTAEGMNPEPVDVYRNDPGTTDTSQGTTDTGSDYQNTDEAISGVPREEPISGISVPLSESGAGDEGDRLAGPAGEGPMGGEGPFANLNPSEMESWHSDPGLNASGATSFEGTTAGPGGDQLSYQTTSYYDPQLGYVPQAQLANAQASTNFFDYMNPMGQPSGLGTTQKVAGTIGSGIGVLGGTLLGGPGLGTWVGGKLGGLAGRAIGGLFGPSQPKTPEEQAQADAGLPAMPSGSVSLPVHGEYAPSAYSPTGQMPGENSREWWSGDFGRDLGSAAQGEGPGDWSYNTMGLPTGSFGLGSMGVGGSGTVGNFATAIGFGGNLGGSGPVNLGAMYNSYFARHYANQMMKGIFMSPEDFGLLKHAMPGLPGMESGIGGSYEDYLRQQQELSAMFQARGYVFAPPSGSEDDTKGGPVSSNVSRGTPPKKTA